MPLWSATETGKPNWCYANNPVGDSEDVFATEQGWVLRHYKNAAKTEFYDEILVAGDFGNAGGLEAVLAEATIDGVYFEEAGNIVKNTVGVVIVNFNELVDVTGTPTLQVRNTTDGADVPATYASGSGTNRLKFNFTAPNANSKVLDFQAQSIAKPSGATIKDAGTSTDTDVAFALADVLGAGGIDKASNNQRRTTVSS